MFDWTPQHGNPGSNRRLRYSPPKRRSRTNRLTAYDAKFGRRTLWTLPPLDVDENSPQPIVADGDKRTRVAELGRIHECTHSLCGIWPLSRSTTAVPFPVMRWTPNNKARPSGVRFCATKLRWGPTRIRANQSCRSRWQ